MKIIEISSRHPLYSFVEHLFTEAFPEDERRDLEPQRQNIDTLPNMHCCVAVDDSETPVGFITYWQFDRFCYIEHFATSAAHRNRGIGASFIKTLLQSLDMPVVLEVELPDNQIARRRIGFYQRLGFDLWSEYDYIQPPYRPEGKSLPMRLMVHGSLSPDKDAATITRIIHRSVYRLESA